MIINNNKSDNIKCTFIRMHKIYLITAFVEHFIIIPKSKQLKKCAISGYNIFRLQNKYEEHFFVIKNNYCMLLEFYFQEFALDTQLVDYLHLFAFKKIGAIQNDILKAFSIK